MVILNNKFNYGRKLFDVSRFVFYLIFYVNMCTFKVFVIKNKKERKIGLDHK